MTSMKKTITAKDIAEMAGVSPATVSYVMNDVPNKVSDKTRKIILELAKKHNYHPNFHARSIKINKCNTIGVFAPLSYKRYQTYTYQCILGIQNVLSENGYSLLLCDLGRESDEPEYMRFFLENRIDGVLIITSTTKRDYDKAGVLRQRNIPHMLINSDPKLGTKNCVLIDNFGGAKDATSHLIELGRRQLVMLTAPFKSGAVEAREGGYRAALLEHGISEPPVIIGSDKGHLAAEGRELAISLLENNVRFDGIFAVNNSMAIGAMQALKESGLRIPGDVAVVGFDDGRESLLVTPRLTSVAQPFREAGVLVAETLLKKLSGEAVDVDIPPLKCQLRVRESTSGMVGDSYEEDMLL